MMMIRITSIVLLLTLLLGGCAGKKQPENYSKGIALYEKENYSESFVLLSSYAEKHSRKLTFEHINSLMKLGEMKEQGKGTDLDKKGAFVYYKKAADYWYYDDDDNRKVSLRASYKTCMLSDNFVEISKYCSKFAPWALNEKKEVWSEAYKKYLDVDGPSSLLLRATISKDKTLVMKAISEGADINKRHTLPTTYFGGDYTPLDVASTYWYEPEIATLLLDNGADSSSEPIIGGRRSSLMMMIGSWEQKMLYDDYFKLRVKYGYKVTVSDLMRFGDCFGSPCNLSSSEAEIMQLLLDSASPSVLKEYNEKIASLKEEKRKRSKARAEKQAKSDKLWRERVNNMSCGDAIIRARSSSTFRFMTSLLRKAPAGSAQDLQNKKERCAIARSVLIGR